MFMVTQNTSQFASESDNLMSYILSSYARSSETTTSSLVSTCAYFINDRVCSPTASVTSVIVPIPSSLLEHGKLETLNISHKQIIAALITNCSSQRGVVTLKLENFIVEGDTTFKAEPLISGKDSEQTTSQENIPLSETRALPCLDNQTTLNGNTLLATCSGNLVASSLSPSSQSNCCTTCSSCCHSFCSSRDNIYSSASSSSINFSIIGTAGTTTLQAGTSRTLKNFISQKFFSISAASIEEDNDHVKSSSISEAKLHRISAISAASRTGRELKDSQQQSSTPSSSLPISAVVVTPVPEILPIPDSVTMKEEKQLEFILKSLVAGGVAGMCAKTTVAPLDRMKILLQAHSKHYSHLGVFSGLRGIVEKERFLALYKGNGAQMVRIFPYAATQFTSFEMYKKLFGEESHIGRFAAGSAAGVTAVALTYPLDTIRARLAFQVTGEHVYSGIYSCATHILREEGGVRALYRGFIPTVCGMIPYAGLSFYCFESFKYICMKYFPTYTCKRHSTNTGGLVLLLYAKLLCGGVAGAAAQTVAYPLDVTRRRMQLAMMDEKTKKFGMGMVSTIKLIYQENGIMRGLYRGMSINYLRAIPMVAVSFSTYELVKQTLRLDTGLPIKTG